MDSCRLTLALEGPLSKEISVEMASREIEADAGCIARGAVRELGTAPPRKRLDDAPDAPACGRPRPIPKPLQEAGKRFGSAAESATMQDEFEPAADSNHNPASGLGEQVGCVSVRPSRDVGHREDSGCCQVSRGYLRSGEAAAEQVLLLRFQFDESA
jgi:hypothetical protein